MTISRILTIALSVVLVTSVSAGDWPQFRGPNCAGIATGKSPLPTRFSPDENLKWSVDLGDGIGCPIVVAGRVFTSGMVDERTVRLAAFDAATGKQLWERKWDAGELVEVHKTNSHAATVAATQRVGSRAEESGALSSPRVTSAST